MFLLWTFAFLLVVLVLYYCRVYSRFVGHGLKYRLPIPPMGTIWSVMFRKSHLCELNGEIYNYFSNERFVGVYEFHKPKVMLRDLELIKNITVRDFSHFSAHRPLCDEELEPEFARNLFSLNGEEWKRMRATLTPAFTSAKLRHMTPFMQDVAKNAVQCIKNQIKGSDSVDIECKDLATKYTNDVIADTVFSLKINSFEKDNYFYQMARSICLLGLRLLAVSLAITAFPRLVRKFHITLFPKKAKDFFCNLIKKTWKEREANNITKPDLTHLLMQERKEWADVDLFAQAVMFFIGGFETSATSLSFALHELALNPDIQNKLLNEIQEHHSIHGDKLDGYTLQDLPYLDMFFSEVLRRWPPAPMMDRLCVKDYNLGKPNRDAPKDYIIRKNEDIIIPIWSFHLNPNYFKDPLKFDPERFSEKNKHLIEPYSYMPFGLGIRNCIGSRFVLFMAKIFIYNLVLNFQISPSIKSCTPSQLCPKNYFIYLKGGHWVQFTPRTY